MWYRISVWASYFFMSIRILYRSQHSFVSATSPLSNPLGRVLICKSCNYSTFFHRIISWLKKLLRWYGKIRYSLLIFLLVTHKWSYFLFFFSRLRWMWKLSQDIWYQSSGLLFLEEGLMLRQARNGILSTREFLFRS